MTRKKWPSIVLEGLRGLGSNGAFHIFVEMSPGNSKLHCGPRLFDSFDWSPMLWIFKCSALASSLKTHTENGWEMLNPERVVSEVDATWGFPVDWDTSTKTYCPLPSPWFSWDEKLKACSDVVSPPQPCPWGHPGKERALAEETCHRLWFTFVFYELCLVNPLSKPLKKRPVMFSTQWASGWK